MQKNVEKKSKEQRAEVFRKWFWGIILVPVALVALMFLLTAVGAFGKLPSFEELENPKSNLATEIFDENGALVGTFFVENRSYVDYEDLSPALVAALISTEDARFYSHSGIDFISLARVGIKTIALGRREQGGGSTITQQLAKTLYPRDSTFYSQGTARKVVTKFKEWITAVKLEYNYTKEEIITMYFNSVFYGSNAYGIKAAARTFFDKEPSQLSVTEAALMVGVVNAPTRFNPVRNPDNATRRRNVVLSRMQSSNNITREQLDSLSQLPLGINYNPISHNDGTATYFREMIRSVMTMPKPKRSDYSRKWDYDQEVRRWESNPVYGWVHKNKKADGSSYNIYRDGLKIYTTLNINMQKHAEEAVRDQLKAIQPKMDAQVRNTGTLFIKTSPESVERIISNAMRYTDRYRSLKSGGATDAEIQKDFRTPVKMRIFTHDGEKEVTMTPRDSILHHKQMLRASFMAVDPSNGHVKAYVGGPDFRYFKYDMVKRGKRQVGSTIKPFVYTFAIDYMGFTPCTMVPNLPVTIETATGEPWSPKEAGAVEYDGVYHPLRWGLSRSRNNYSAWIMKQAKQPKAVADFINQMGIHSYIDPVNALALGTADVSLFEMVGAYATFANQGVFTEPMFVTRVEDRQGNVISTFTPTSTDAINEHSAYTMLQMLEDVVRRGTAGSLGWRYQFSGIEMGGKTGTSQENRDAWFVGLVPKLVAGTWVGGEDQSVHLTSRGEGSVLALPIYGEFMTRVYNDPTLGINRADRFRAPVGAKVYNCPDSEGPTDGTYAPPTGAEEFFD